MASSSNSSSREASQTLTAANRPIRKRRKGKAHRGVVLLPPDPKARTGHRARWLDPDSGKHVWKTLNPELNTVELREDWASQKAKAIALRQLQLMGGAPRATGTGLADAVKRYFEDHPQLASETQALYRAAADKLLAWSTKAGIETADDLDKGKLVGFRAELVKEPKSIRKTGGRRGEREALNTLRSPSTVNRELRSVGTVLTYLRRLGLLPNLSSDDVRDGLQKLRIPQKRIDYRKPHELQKLLDAALRHDAETFDATREEHAGKRPKGSTLRHEPIAPVIAVALVTGLRISHLLALVWSDVDLEALDHEGRPVGEIVPQGGSSTKRTGIIGLEISPGLRRLLAAMKLKSGGRGKVFTMTEHEVNAALKRLIGEYGAPAGSSWSAFRRTCGCYLTNAPGIFGSASAFRSAKQLGHSVQIAERHYVDVVRGIPRDARTVEAAMQITQQFDRVIAAVRPASAHQIERPYAARRAKSGQPWSEPSK